MLPLLQAYPRLAAAHPVAGLLAGVTPVQPLPGAAGVFLKRDDLTATDYGGNKIRKLDFILADARARGKKSVVAFGYAGSNFVAATAWHGRKLELTTVAGLLPQAPADYVVDNLSVCLAAGARLFVRASESALALEALARSAAACAREQRAPAWIPPGGSSALGALGFVNAALELKAQIARGELPLPRAIYLPFSSMGTVAGLAAGLALAGVDSRIVAAQVVGKAHASRAKLERLQARLAALLRAAGVVPPAPASVELRTEFYGGAYARATPEAKAAMQRFETASGARADAAYSGKALACLYADLDASRLRAPALFWHTLSLSRRPPGVPRAAPASAPAALRHYWEAA